MKIAVAGATGTAGRHVCAVAEEAGHRIVPLSRSAGVDLVTGEGLDGGVLDGCGAVVDAGAVAPADESMTLEEAHVRAAANLAKACRSAGVGRLVVLSIAGVHDSGFDDFPYYVAKRRQEQAVRESGQPSLVVSSAQWFEFATNPAAVSVDGSEVVVQDWLIQPVALRSVAELLVEAATADGPVDDVAVAGPRPMRLSALTAGYLEATGDARAVRAVEPPLEAFGDGRLLAPEGAEIRGPELAEWLRDPPRLPLG